MMNFFIGRVSSNDKFRISDRASEEYTEDLRFVFFFFPLCHEKKERKDLGRNGK